MGTEKKQKMVLKYQYDALSEEGKVEFREAYMAKSGMPYTTFYYKLRTDSFRPLEQKLFEELLQGNDGSFEYNESLVTNEQFEQLKIAVYDGESK